MDYLKDIIGEGVEGFILQKNVPDKEVKRYYKFLMDIKKAIKKAGIERVVIDYLEEGSDIKNGEAILEKDMTSMDVCNKKGETLLNITVRG